MLLTGTQHAADGLDTRAMPRGAGERLASRPAVIAIHDNGDMTRDRGVFRLAW